MEEKEERQRETREMLRGERNVYRKRESKSLREKEKKKYQRKWKGIRIEDLRKIGGMKRKRRYDFYEKYLFAII